MNLLALLVALTISSAASEGSCAAVDPISNQAVWRHSGALQMASYTDRGGIIWSRPVPHEVEALTTLHAGSDIRVRCS